MAQARDARGRFTGGKGSAGGGGGGGGGAGGPAARQTTILDFALDTRNLSRYQSAISRLTGFVGNVLQGALTGAVALTGALGFGVIEVNREFESLVAGLRGAEGSGERAASVLKDLRKLAADTPLELGELVRAWTRLRNLGLEPSLETLEAFGNVSAAIPGKKINDFTEAVADAITGEWERLKEFGIRARRVGKDVDFTFKGITKRVKFNANDITAYLTQIGKTDFAGSLRRQGETLGGLFDRAKEQAKQFLTSIGQSGVTAQLRELLKTFLDLSGGADHFGVRIGVLIAARLQRLNAFIQRLKVEWPLLWASVQSGVVALGKRLEALGFNLALIRNGLSLLAAGKAVGFFLDLAQAARLAWAALGPMATALGLAVPELALLLALVVGAGLALVDFTTYVQTGTSPLYAWAAANRDAGGATGEFSDALADMYEGLGAIIAERLPAAQIMLTNLGVTFDNTVASLNRLGESLGLGSDAVGGFAAGALSPITGALRGIVFMFDLWSMGVLVVIATVDVLLEKLGALADWLATIEGAAPGALGDATRLISSGGNLLGGFARGQAFNPGAVFGLGQSAANLLSPSPAAASGPTNKTANNTANVNQTIIVNGDPASLAAAAREGAGSGASDFFSQQAQNFAA